MALGDGGMIWCGVVRGVLHFSLPPWQPFVSDELKRRKKLLSLTLVDFYEAICRLCTMMPLPSESILLVYGCGTYKEFFDQVEAGVHDGEAIAGPELEMGEDFLTHHWKVARTVACFFY